MMALEEFYIRKNKLLVPPDKNRLDISDITGLNTDYPELKKMRDTALHFDLPMNETYHSFFTDNIEKQFAKEIDKTWTCDTLPNMHRNVLSVFLDKMRNDIFDKSKIYTEGKGKKVDVRKTEDEALKKYFKELSK
jgi:hypothetical protein